ncbi:hypothetical protein B0O99DRAFT_620416 [Bisporella sp. PMI_857]|nr:hypothetical protein B0O99DRAFT_620416 [Bisporella sp. PMI_857]
MSGSPKAKAKTSREPPPSLFLPPSQNASHVSIPGIAPAAPPNPSLNPRPNLPRQRSQRSGMPSRVAALDGNLDVADSSLGRPVLRQGRLDSEVKRQADRTDALWAEMQSTLEEVELSAVNGNHVFGPDHSKALEELRAAQIGLAQAWARSEADDQVENADKENKGLGSKIGGIIGSEGGSKLDAVGTEGKGSTVASGSQRPGSSSAAGVEGLDNTLEQETGSDILLARKRREANDWYFQRVNEGVLEVVAKLEEVASAMRAVEKESRDIWSDTGSPGQSVSG